MFLVPGGRPGGVCTGREGCCQRQLGQRDHCPVGAQQCVGEFEQRVGAGIVKLFESCWGADDVSVLVA